MHRRGLLQSCAAVAGRDLRRSPRRRHIHLQVLFPIRDWLKQPSPCLTIYLQRHDAVLLCGLFLSSAFCFGSLQRRCAGTSQESQADIHRHHLLKVAIPQAQLGSVELSFGNMAGHCPALMSSLNKWKDSTERNHIKMDPVQAMQTAC